MQLEAGTRLGHYEVVSSLGAGGVGEVYRARDTWLDRNVAVKILSRGTEPGPGLQTAFLGRGEDPGWVDPDSTGGQK